MNIHPLFVHFPIGVLVLYALIEIIPVARLYPRLNWLDIKTSLVIVGAALAWLTAGTGELAQSLIHDPAKLKIIDTHSTFAYTTVTIFTVLGVAYLIRLIVKEHRSLARALMLSERGFLARLASFLARPPVAPLLALIGLITITITGGLGASIVYGPDVDPFVRVIYGLFF